MKVSEYSIQINKTVEQVLNVCKKIGIGVLSGSDILTSDDIILLNDEFDVSDLVIGGDSSVGGSSTGGGATNKSIEKNSELIGGPNYINVNIEVLGQSSGVVSELIDSLNVLFKSLNIVISVPLNTAGNLFLAKKIVFESINNAKDVLTNIITTKKLYAENDANTALLFAYQDGILIDEDGNIDDVKLEKFINEYDINDESSMLDKVKQVNFFQDVFGTDSYKNENGTYDINKIKLDMNTYGISDSLGYLALISGNNNISEDIENNKSEEISTSKDNLSKKTDDNLSEEKDGENKKVDYSKVPNYFQHDYANVMYGAHGTVATHGCGITSLAMVASYLLNREILPDELAVKYGMHNTKDGSSWAIFSKSAEDYGLNLEKEIYYSTEEDLKEVVTALENGSVVIANAMKTSVFTNTGHFIVLTGITEDGKITVNDPNKFNYKEYNEWAGKNGAAAKTLESGFENGFEQDVFKYGNIKKFWVYAPKVEDVSIDESVKNIDINEAEKKMTLQDEVVPTVDVTKNEAVVDDIKDEISEDNSLNLFQKFTNFVSDKVSDIHNSIVEDTKRRYETQVKLDQHNANILKNAVIGLENVVNNKEEDVKQVIPNEIIENNSEKEVVSKEVVKPDFELTLEQSEVINSDLDKVANDTLNSVDDVSYSIDNTVWTGPRLKPKAGFNENGPMGYETWYPLAIEKVVGDMEKLYGHTNVEYRIREDGVRVLSGVNPDGVHYKDLVIVAADVRHPDSNPNGTFERGQFVETSLGPGIVADYCEEAVNKRKSSGKVHFDIAAAWWDEPYVSKIYKNNVDVVDEYFSKVNEQAFVSLANDSLEKEDVESIVEQPDIVNLENSSKNENIGLDTNVSELQLSVEDPSFFPLSSENVVSEKSESVIETKKEVIDTTDSKVNPFSGLFKNITNKLNEWQDIISEDTKSRHETQIAMNQYYAEKIKEILNEKNETVEPTTVDNITNMFNNNLDTLNNINIDNNDFEDTEFTEEGEVASVLIDNPTFDISLEDISLSEDEIVQTNLKPKNNSDIAHRGFRDAKNPENSAGAFRRAGEEGFWGCEADIRFDSNGVLVCSHNAVKKGENPPLFEEYLDICKEYGMTAVIDLKYINGVGPEDPYLAPAILKIIEEKGMLDSCVLQTNNDTDIPHIREISADARIWLLTDNLDEHIKLIQDNNVECVNITLSSEHSINSNKIRKLEANGVDVCVWDVRTNKEKDNVLGLGSKYVMSDNDLNISPYQEGDIDFNEIIK